MNSLRERLQALRTQSGAVTDTKTRPVVSLRDEIQRRRVGLGATYSPKAKVRKDSARLAHDLGGTQVAPGLILLERQHEIGSHHGNAYISADLAPAIDLFAGLSEQDASAVVFLDTETTGLAGGTGTLAFMVGLARFQESCLSVCQYLLTAISGESAMLELVGEHCVDAAVMVTYNGLSFDRPLLQARYRLDNREDPFTRLEQIDLVHYCRRAFARRWSNCRLQTVEQRLLGFTRLDDLPGAEAPMAWLDWLQRDDDSRLKAVAEHNRWDLVSLASLLRVLGEVYRAPDGHGVDHHGIAGWYCGNRRDDEALRILRTGASMLDVRGKLLLARLAHRRGETAFAVALWEELAAKNCVEAMLCLAKHLEHQCRDLNAALAVTRRLIELEISAPEHRHRLERLSRKAGL